MSTFITPEGLIQLKNYKYHSSQYTWMDNALDGYWKAVVQLMPMWLAPNLITFIGWILIIVSYTNMLRYDYTVQKDIPNYCFILAAFCVWAYSTLDAIDGKQARRTKSSSPLGQLFDHGCDSFATAFFILALGQAFKLEGFEMLSIFVSAQIAFWSASWMEHHTGILVTNVGQFGVTESHLIAISVHLLTGIFGQQLWQFTLVDILPKSLILPLTNEILVSAVNLKLGGLIAFGFSVFVIILTVYQIGKAILKSSDRMQALGSYLPIALIVGVEMIWVRFSFYDKYRGLVLLNFGLLCSLIICKVIISSVTKMKLHTFHREAIPLIIGTLLMIACEILHLTNLMPTVFWGIFLVNTISILYFLVGVINQITTFLGIYCFSIQKQEQKKQ